MALDPKRYKAVKAKEKERKPPPKEGSGSKAFDDAIQKLLGVKKDKPKQ